MPASNTSEITTRASAQSHPSRIRSRIARQLLPFPEPRIPIPIAAISAAVHSIDQLRRRIAALERNDPNLTADSFQHSALLCVQTLWRVVAALYVNRRPDALEKVRRAHFRKNRDVVNAAQCGEHFRAISLRVQRPRIAFQRTDRFITVEPNCECIAQHTR